MRVSFSSLKTVTQASLGSAVLLVILITILTVSYFKLHDIKHVANRISDLRIPTVNTTNLLENNINTSLANLRGWMLLQDAEFILQRKEAWKNIRSAQRELNHLSQNWTNPEDIERLNSINTLLDEFEASQDKVELLAEDESNLPATHLLLTKATPASDLVFQQITKLMHAEQYALATPERKKLYAAMANFRGSFAIGLTHIKAFLISADPIFIDKFNSSWQENSDAFEALQQYHSLLDTQQQKDFALLENATNQYSLLPQEIFKLRKDETWNLANYELQNVVANLSHRLINLLEEMIKEQTHLLAMDTQVNEGILAKYLQTLVFLTLLAIGSSIGVFFYMKRKVSIPLNSAINDAISLAEKVASGQYDASPLIPNSANASSYETTLLLNSLEGMASDVKRQAKELTQAKEAAELAVQEARIAQTQLSAQKDAMDEHSLVSITDIKGTITYANDKFCEISGYREEELIGKNHSLLNSGNEPKDYWRDMYLKVSKGEAWHDEVKNKAKDGHFYWVDTTIIPMYEEGKLTGYTSIRTDISEAVGTREDLTTQKNAMDQHSLISITDIKGTITYANDKFCEISGYSKEELIGQNHSLLNSGHEPKDYWREMYLHVSKGQFWHDEVKNKAKNGRFYWVDTTIVPMYENDKLSGYTSIRTDITQAKELEQSLIEARDQAEVANESKTDFLANMSHEIRTPMNGVIGMTNLLLDSDLNKEQFKLAKTVKTSAESLLYIINDILDFSKVEAGMLELEDINFNLGTMVEDLGSTMHYLAEEKQLELICPANPILNQWLYADPGRIRQILTNLIGNAIKFTEHGEVAVFCHVEQLPENKRFLRFEIKDTGIGISEENQAKLFSKFTQADSSTTRRYGGTGLGLSISQKLVTLMGGEIGIKSELGKGATFWFSLELQSAEAEKEAPIQLADIQQQKVLVVDDNETNRELLRQLLTLWKVEHYVVASGMEALKTLQENDDSPFTIGLLDMHMPDMDGAQLCEKIKHDAGISGIKLVMLSSQAQRGDAKKMQAIGFDGYLPKPIHQSELYNIIQQVAGLTSEDDILVTRYTDKERVLFKAHILVVEDNVTNQAVIKGMLEKFGITIDLAGNGEEALAALRNGTNYNLVFMDCQMPVMDGYTATRHIRDPDSGLFNHSIPVIAMTANVMRGDREKCLAAGMYDYVAKPIDPTKLRRILTQWLPESAVSNSTSEDADVISDEPKTDEDQADTLIFDYEVMNAMLMGDKELMSTIAETFLEDVAIQIEQLKSILDTDNTKEAAAISHKIKGASGNVGGKVLSASALKMEMAGKAGDMEAVRQGMQQLENDFNLLKEEMKRTLV